MIEQFTDRHGILLRRDAVEMGIDDKALRRARDAGELVRLRQGLYAAGRVWHELDRPRRHLLLTEGVHQLYDSTAVATSHASAVVAHGGPTWRVDLTDVHLTHLDGTRNRNLAGIHHHRGRCRVDDVTRRSGRWVTAPTRTALDAATRLGRDPAVCVLDWFLEQGLTSREELERELASKTHWPDSLALHTLLRLTDGRSQSVGETRTRLLLHDHQLPRAVAQFVVRHPSGLVAGIVDFAWPEAGLMLEFDGRQKYLALRRPGESVADAVIREKRREDLLRELTGWTMIRIGWADLERPEHLVSRLRKGLERRAA